jgi:hypothetical protein
VQTEWLPDVGGTVNWSPWITVRRLTSAVPPLQSRSTWLAFAHTGCGGAGEPLSAPRHLRVRECPLVVDVGFERFGIHEEVLVMVHFQPKEKKTEGVASPRVRRVFA